MAKCCTCFGIKFNGRLEWFATGSSMGLVAAFPFLLYLYGHDKHRIIRIFY